MIKHNTFNGDKKLPMNTLSGVLEKKLLQATVHKFPKGIETYHLTAMTIVWSAGIICSGYVAQSNTQWLWLSSLLIFLQWVTDLYDGAIGRFRDTGLVKWGYYMDHLLDYVFLCSIFIGYSFLLSEQNTRLVYILLMIAAGFMTSSFLSFAATNEFKITYLGFGPTEMRLFFILVNTYIIFFGVTFIENYLKYLIPISLIVLAIVVFRTQKYIWNIDMEDKRSREKD